MKHNPRCSQKRRSLTASGLLTKIKDQCIHFLQSVLPNDELVQFGFNRISPTKNVSQARFASPPPGGGGVQQRKNAAGAHAHRHAMCRSRSRSCERHQHKAEQRRVHLATPARKQRNANYPSTSPVDGSRSMLLPPDKAKVAALR